MRKHMNKILIVAILFVAACEMTKVKNEVKLRPIEEIPSAYSEKVEKYGLNQKITYVHASYSNIT